MMKNYRANVKAMGQDKAQLLHIACLRRNIYAVDTLVDAGADVDAEFGRELCEKFNKNAKWSDDFGGKLTPLTFAIINDEFHMTKCLLRNKANVAIRSTSNKTLLMYAVKSGNYRIIDEIIRYFYYDCPELINAYDNDGLHVVHYLIPNDEFGEFRYHESISLSSKKFVTLMTLQTAGIDINATVNGNPETLLSNMVALRGCYHLLPEFLNLRIPINSKSRALRNATLPVDPEKFISVIDYNNKYDLEEEMRETRRNCIEYILENYIIRRSLELFVPQEEIELMDQLIAIDSEIRQFVKDYQRKYIEGILKSNFIHHWDVRITLHELLIRIVHGWPLNVRVDEEFVELLKKSINNFEIYNQIRQLFPFMISEVFEICKRRKLLKIIKKIRDVKKALPLPYEIILEILEYVGYSSLKKFIDAFYEVPVASN